MSTYRFRGDSNSLKAYIERLPPSEKVIDITTTQSNGVYLITTGGAAPPAIAPTNDVAPVVSGNAFVGQTLTTTDGTWSGTAPITFTYQWQRDSVNISGATNSTYILVQADADKDIRCVVTGTNSAGSASANSNALYIFDADYQSVLDRATALGYTLPSSPQRSLQNSIIVALKSSGVWNKTDIFYMFANNGSQEFATLNWKNPLLYQASLVNSPSFTSNLGFNTDGATSYISTNWTPNTDAVNMTLNSLYRSIYKTVVGNHNNYIGVLNDARDRMSLTASAQVIRLNNITSDLTPAVDASAVGTHVYMRNSSTTARILVNSTFTNHTTTSSGRSTFVRTLLRSVTNFTNPASTFSFFAEGGNLSDAEASSLVTAINTYMGSI